VDAPHIVQTPGLLELQDLPPAGRDARGCLRPARRCRLSPCSSRGGGSALGRQSPAHLSPGAQRTVARGSPGASQRAGHGQQRPRHPSPAPHAADPGASRPSGKASSTRGHLRIKLFGGGPGDVGPGHVAPPEVVGAVGRVPGVVAARPGQGAREGRVEVVESPGDDGVVVEGDVEADDANGEADAWGEKPGLVQPLLCPQGTHPGRTAPSPAPRGPESAVVFRAWGSLTFKDGADALPDGDGARPVELPQGQLHVEEGHPSENRHQRVGDEKGSCGARSGAAVTTTAPRRPASAGGLRVEGCGRRRPSQRRGTARTRGLQACS